MLTRCSACFLACDSVVSNLPCEECLSSLLTSPPICAVCLGLTCSKGNCERPWLRIEGDDGGLRFDSVNAAYLSVGPGSRVLKSWKKSPSPSLTRFLRRGVKEKLAGIESPLVLVPIPQNSQRRWALEGGSALRLCEIIVEIRRNPADRILDLLDLSRTSVLESQALKKGGHRYSRRSAIQPRAAPAPRICEDSLRPDAELLLIDDFLTSGSTLRSAAGAVRSKLSELDGKPLGRRRIGVFVLGFRPALFGADGRIG